MTTRSEDASNIAEADFLAELKSQFDKDIDLRKTLDNKANTLQVVLYGDVERWCKKYRKGHLTKLSLINI